MITKKTLLEKEKNCTLKYAATSDCCLTSRLIQEKEKYDKHNFEIRLPFQRDRDRIIHSRAFRRLMHKTQVFNANKGDHYRNRLTHTLEVNQIARSIGKVLGLNDELIEAIALGHDLGHTPFGHIGERTLHLILSGQLYKSEENINIPNLGGFKHNYQSLQIVDNLEKRTTDYSGLNLTLAVREGILKHTGRKIRVPQKDNFNRKIKISKQDVNYDTLNLKNININLPSMTLEGQTVAIADEIAQCTHDLEDGLRAKIITLSDITKNKLVNRVCRLYDIKFDDLKETVDVRNTLIKHLVGFLINDVCISSYKKLEQSFRNSDPPKFTNYNDVYKDEYIIFSDEVKEMHNDLSQLITNLVISSQSISQSDSKSEFIITRLFKAYFIHPQQLPDYILRRYFQKREIEFNRLAIENMLFDLQSDTYFIRLICDHIAGMTDQYAAREYIRLYEPEYY